MSTRAPGADLGAEKPNIYKARDYYTKPYQKTRRTKPERKSMGWRTTYMSRKEAKPNLNLIELQNPNRPLRRKKESKLLAILQE